jgi:hypothetical protein
MKNTILFTLLICTPFLLKAQDYDYSKINLDSLKNISITTFKDKTYEGKLVAQIGDTLYIITPKRDILMVLPKDIKNKSVYLPKVRQIFNDDGSTHYGIVFKFGILPLGLWDEGSYLSAGCGFEVYLNQKISVQMTYNYSKIGVDAPEINQSLIPEVRRYFRTGLKTHIFTSAFVELDKNKEYTGSYCQDTKFQLLENRKSIGLGTGLGLKQQFHKNFGIEVFVAAKYKYSNREKLFYTGRTQNPLAYCGTEIIEYDKIFHGGYRLGFNFIIIFN